MLPAKMPFDEARNLLWRRERNKEGSDETYSVGIGPNHVLVREWRDCPQVETVLYTDFNSSGKEDLTVQQLADAACQSVKLADPGRDGITYLENAIDAGVETPLTAAYRAEILRRTGAATLAQARELLKQQSPV